MGSNKIAASYGTLVKCHFHCHGRMWLMAHAFLWFCTLGNDIRASVVWVSDMEVAHSTYHWTKQTKVYSPLRTVRVQGQFIIFIYQSWIMNLKQIFYFNIKYSSTISHWIELIKRQFKYAMCKDLSGREGLMLEWSDWILVGTKQRLEPFQCCLGQMIHTES